MNYYKYRVFYVAMTGEYEYEFKLNSERYSFEWSENDWNNGLLLAQLLDLKK